MNTASLLSPNQHVSYLLLDSCSRSTGCFQHMVWLCDSQRGAKSSSENTSTQYSSCGHKKSFYISLQSSSLVTFSIFFYKRWLLLVNHSSQRKHSYLLLSFENRHADTDLPVKTSLSSLTILQSSWSVPSWQVNKILEMMTDCCFEKFDWHFFSNTHQQRVTCDCRGECQIMAIVAHIYLQCAETWA